jgi:glycosyltransferase involved in cell wall biosynthesis
MRVSVVVPAYNAERTLAACLRALTAQTGLSEPIEIVVVDDGSKDGTVELARSFAGVMVVQQENAGPGAARNAGAARTHGEIVLFTDSDCVPEPNWAAEMAHAFETPEVAAVMGRTRTVQRGDFISKVQEGSDLVASEPGTTTRINTNNLGLVAELATCMPFDAALRIYGEDTDLGWRVLRAGRKTLFWPRAEVEHHHPHTLRSFMREGFMQGRGSARLHYKYSKWLPRDLAFAVIALACLVLSAAPPLRAVMLLSAAISTLVFLAALGWNELVYKGKSFGLTLLTYPLQLVWYLFKLAGYLHMMVRILRGAEPLLTASKRRFSSMPAGTFQGTGS